MGESREPTPAAPELSGARRRRAFAGIYGTAFFSLSMVPMSSILVPLWMVSLGASPLEIGIAIGARSFLPLLLSIHGGVLMDRLGTRRVTLAVALMAVALFPAYPLLPWVVAIVLLQALFGLAQGLCWVGSQTFYGRIMGGQAGQAGRLVLFSNGGCFAGPLLVGTVAEHAGTHAAFGFMCLWASLMVLFTLLVPSRQSLGAGGPRVGWRDLLPRLADYRSALALLAVPAVVLVMVFTFIRIAAASVQTSFYVVYLGEIALGETLIGLLLGSANLVATVTPLLIGPLAKRLSPPAMLVGATIGNIVFISVTPLLTTFVPLAIAAVLYGACVGLGFPTLLTVLARAVGRGEQGKSVGLRTTANRLASLVIPVAMGGAVELLGLEASFAVVGAVLLVATFATMAWMRRHPGVTTPAGGA